MVISTRLALSRTGGFTLIELMVGVSVLAILLAVGIPSFSAIMRNNRIASGANNLVGALNFARSEAIKRGDPVTVCPSTNGTSCDNTTAWAGGLIAFRDAAGTSGTFDPGDLLLQVWPAVEGGLTLTSSRNFIQYTSNGMPNPLPSTANPESFSLQKPGCTGNYARRITVTVSGRVTSAVAACSS